MVIAPEGDEDTLSYSILNIYNEFASYQAMFDRKTVEAVVQ